MAIAAVAVAVLLLLLLLLLTACIILLYWYIAVLAQARKLWDLLEKKQADGAFSHTFGALDPVQVGACR